MITEDAMTTWGILFPGQRMTRCLFFRIYAIIQKEGIKF